MWFQTIEDMRKAKAVKQELKFEQYINDLNTKALNYIANKYPGLVNEAFANIDREENENVQSWR